jgi:hypothetical protein
MTENYLQIYAENPTQRRTGANLIAFGLEILYRAKCIREINELKSILEKLNRKEIYPNDNRIIDFMQEYLIDCIRILIFFENYMIAELLVNDYCIHVINKNVNGFENLAKAQSKSPIKLEEINNIEKFLIEDQFDRINHVVLQEKTIELSKLFGSTEYTSKYTFDKSILVIVKELYKYRNRLPLNYSIDYQQSLKTINYLKKIVQFADETSKRIKE